MIVKKLTEVTKSFFGLSNSGPFLQREDFEALRDVAEPASTDLDAAMNHIELKRITATALNIMSEVLTIALINVVASGNQELQRQFAWIIFGLLSASTLAKSTLANWQYRLNDIAIQRVFTYLQTIDGLQNSEKRHLLSRWQSDINAMSMAELQFSNLPSNKLFWLTSKLINIAYLFPELTPIIIGQWFLSIFQISGNTKAFKKLQSQFQSIVQENSTAMKLHAKNTKAEKAKEKTAMIKVTLLTNLINTITQSASLPFIWALANGANLPTLIATSLPSLNTLSSEVSATLGSAIGAHMQFTNAAIGRSKLEHILEQIQKTQVMIQNHTDRKKHRDRLASEPSIEEAFKQKNIVIPKGKTALLFSEVRVPRPTDDVTLIEDLTGYILLETGKITVISGESGRGKSLLAETILQNYLNASGRTGIIDTDGVVTDFRDETKNQKEFGLYINEDDMAGDIYWADLAFPYNLQVALLATAGFDIDDTTITEFLRLSWGDKVRNAGKSQVLTEVFEKIKRYLSDKLSETGLFTNSGKDMQYYLSQEIGHYSDGEKQRLFLSSVYLIPDLPLVIIDEPFRALDSMREDQNTLSSKQAMAQFLLKLEKRGTDVIIIAHESDDDIATLLGDGVGCQLHLENGQLTPRPGYENMAQLTSTPINTDLTSVDSKTLGITPHDTEKLAEIDAKIIAELKRCLEELGDIVEQGKSSYKRTFEILDPSDNPQIKKATESVINLFEQIAKQFTPTQKINHTILKVYEWELVGEALSYYLNQLADNTRDLIRVTTIFETIFYALDSTALIIPTNSMYKGQTLKELLYEFIQTTVSIEDNHFDKTYQEKVKQRYRKIVTDTQEALKKAEQEKPIYSITLQDVEYLREYMDDSVKIEIVTNALALLTRNNRSTPQESNYDSIVGAKTVITNFLDQFKKLQQFISEKQENYTVTIGSDVLSINDWKIIHDILGDYFTYLYEDKQLDYEEKRIQYHEILALFESIFYALPEEANTTQVDWLVNDYSLKLVMYGFLHNIVEDEFEEYLPESALVNKVTARYNQLVVLDTEAKLKLRESED